MASIISYGCGRIMPGAIECDGHALPEDKPRLVFIDANMPAAFDLLNAAIRKRVAAALRGIDDSNIQKALAFSPASHRNQSPVALLGSWRYIPAVAALKEISSACCLGTNLSMKTSTIVGDFNAFRLHDIAKWLGAELEVGAIQGKLDIALELASENGWLKTDFSLDGQKATFQACLAGHAKERIIPPANPAVSELAVLGMSLPPDGRIKTLPMMMTI